MRTKKVIGSICLLFFTAAISYGQTSIPSLSANSNTMITRTPDSRGWTDPALNHNRLLRDQLGDGTYTMIGIYKVKGSPYLFGGKHNSDLFSQKEKAYNIDIRYNTYNQEVEFYSTANSVPLVKVIGEVDSFIIKQDVANGISNDIKFVYGPLIGSSEKTYFQLVEAGSRYSLYKRYKSDLGYVSENYVQPDLRQFDLLSDYFIVDNETKTVKKLKQNTASINKEFKSIKDVSAIVTSDAFAVNPEETLRKAIQSVNVEKKAF
ncbi:MAG TPA: hypothetical protein VFZ42_12760 [Chitinophagaceae bacterium]